VCCDIQITQDSAQEFVVFRLAEMKHGPQHRFDLQSGDRLRAIRLSAKNPLESGMAFRIRLGVRKPVLPLYLTLRSNLEYRYTL
jgi:hypothetical protein